MGKGLYKAQALPVGQCGILTMVDTPISAIFMRKIFQFWPFLEMFPHSLSLIIFLNAESSVYSDFQIS